MTTTVFKYLLNFDREDVATVNVPLGAEALRVAEQGGSYHLWAKVDRAAQPSQMFIRIAGTGHDIPQDAGYINSIDAGPFVWHFFELIR